MERISTGLGGIIYLRRMITALQQAHSLAEAKIKGEEAGKDKIVLGTPLVKVPEESLQWTEVKQKLPEHEINHVHRTRSLIHEKFNRSSMLWGLFHSLQAKRRRESILVNMSF